MTQKKTIEGDIVYGIHPIIELLKAKRRKVIKIYTASPEPKQWPAIQKLLPAYIKVEYVDRARLGYLADSGEHQGVVALAAPFSFQKQFFNPSKAPRLLLLDSIQDPRNVGALLRSAYCTNMSGVIMVEKGSSSVTPTVLKASAGLAEHLAIYQASSIQAALTELKKAQYQLYLATVTQGKRVNDIAFNQPLCLVIGSEEKGISANLLDQGIRISIPEREGASSYNASVAGGILMFMIGISCKAI